jgi:uncharacterized protein YcnI
MRPSIGRALLGGGIAITVLATLGGIAEAHVTIDSLGAAEQGGESAKFAFSVPNEQDDATTLKVAVQLPTDHPLASVSVAPKPGWDIVTTTRKLTTPVEVEGAQVDTVVDTITWTSTDGTGIGKDQFDQFWISAGPLPDDVDHLEFPAVQTYSDGDVVRWIDPTPANGEEPEHPLPTLALVKSGDDTSTGSSNDDDSSTLPVIALIVGALGLVAGITALALSRRRTTPTTPPATT